MLVKEFATFVQENLPREKIPVRVGRTDYINPRSKSTDFKELYCWQHDHFDRLVFVIDNHIVFQRYTDREDVYMISKDGWDYREVTNDDINHLTEKINGRQTSTHTSLQ